MCCQSKYLLCMKCCFLAFLIILVMYVCACVREREQWTWTEMKKSVTWLTGLHFNLVQVIFVVFVCDCICADVCVSKVAIFSLRLILHWRSEVCETIEFMFVISPLTLGFY